METSNTNVRLPIPIKTLLQEEAKADKTDLSKLIINILNDYLKNKAFLKKQQEEKAKKDYIEFVEKENQKKGDFVVNIPESTPPKKLSWIEIVIKGVLALVLLLLFIIIAARAFISLKKN